MWCNGGFRAGTGGNNINHSNNPYIDYRSSYNNTLDYSIYDNSGTLIFENDFPSNGITYINSFYSTNWIDEKVKWIVIKDTRSSTTSGKNALIKVYKSGSSELSLGTDYLLYVYENPASSSNNGWRSCQVIWDSTGGDTNGEGAFENGVQYPIIINSLENNLDIYYRIGLKNQNSLDNKIHKIDITYGNI